MRDFLLGLVNATMAAIAAGVAYVLLLIALDYFGLFNNQYEGLVIPGLLITMGVTAFTSMVNWYRD